MPLATLVKVIFAQVRHHNACSVDLPEQETVARAGWLAEPQEVTESSLGSSQTKLFKRPEKRIEKSTGNIRTKGSPSVLMIFPPSILSTLARFFSKHCKSPQGSHNRDPLLRTALWTYGRFNVNGPYWDRSQLPSFISSE